MLCVHQIRDLYIVLWASQVVLVVKNLPVSARDIRDVGSIPGSGKSQGGGHDNPLQYSCLENPMDRGAWQAMVHRVTKNQTPLRQLSMHALRYNWQIKIAHIPGKHKVMTYYMYVLWNDYHNQINTSTTSHSYFSFLCCFVTATTNFKLQMSSSDSISPGSIY